MSPTNATQAASWPQKEAEILTRYAVLAYEQPATIEHEIAVDGAKNFVWFESAGGRNDTQAFACEIGRDLYIAFRGTQEARDFVTDAKIRKIRLPSFDGRTTIRVGQRDAKAHRGFSDALDAIWSSDSAAYHRAFLKHPDTTLSAYLRDKSQEADRRIWLTGHSLGGALATLAAARIQLSEDETPFKDRIAGLITIGSPRVLNGPGARELIRELGEERIYRIYRTLDPVPALPRWMYKHVSGRRSVVGNEGELVIGARGSRRMLATSAAGLRALEDMIGSLLPGQHEGLTSLIADHDKEGYYQAVKNYREGTRLKSLPLFARGSVALFKLLLAVAVGGSVGHEMWRMWPFD